VYRKGPGDVEFTPLPNPNDSSSPLTIPRNAAFPEGESSPEANRPVRYEFEDTNVGESGLAGYYVNAFDTESGKEGAVSNLVFIDLETGIVNAAPVAKLAVDTDYGGAPLTVTFDASESHDDDGTIAEYRFDFDGDGIVDYSTNDAEPPTESSGGTVTDIMLGESPWLVTATYIQFSSEFYPSSVTAVDNLDGESLPCSVDIGVTGWAREVIKSSAGNIFEFTPMDIALDPANGEVVIVGYSTLESGYIRTPGVYFARRHGPDAWSVEFVFDYESDPIWNPNDEYLYGQVLGGRIAWDEDCNPIILLNGRKDYFTGVAERVFAVTRSAGGEWSFVNLPEVDGADGPFTWGKVSSGFIQFEPGRFVANCYGKLGGEGKTDYLLWYDKGVWIVEYMNWHAVDDTNYGPLRGLSEAPDGTLYTSTPRNQDWDNLFVLRRESPGIWTKEYGIGGHHEPNQVSFGLETFTISSSGDLAFLYFIAIGPSLEDYVGSYGLCVVAPEGLSLTQFPDGYRGNSKLGVLPIRDGYCAFTSDLTKPSPRLGSFVIYMNGSLLWESPFEPYDPEMGGHASVACATTFKDGRSFTYLSSSGGWQAYAYRVDPKIE